MPLIKNINANRVIEDAVVLDLGDLMQQAEQILTDARAQAASILDDARAEAERIRERAAAEGRESGRQTGHAEGREQGAAAARQEVQAEFAPRAEALVQAWTDALAEWERERREMLSAAREDVLEFAFELGRRIVHRIVEIDPSLVQEQLDEALSLVRKPSGLTIALHPEDRPLVEAVLPRLLASVDGAEDAMIVEDDSIARGGCILRMTGGRIDARIDTQLDRVARTLLARSPRLRPAGPTGEDRP